jgi:hypothetical protein
MERSDLNNTNDGRDLMFMFGGAALMLLGAGLILSHPQVRRYMGAVNLNDLVEGALPDFERYMKLRQM